MLLLPLLLSRLGRGVTASVKFVVLLIAGAAIAMLLGITAAGSISMRYHADYAPELLVVGLFVCVWMFPPPSPGVREALVSSGTVREGDVLMVEYVGDGKLCLVAQHWGEPLVNGPEIAIDPKIPHEFSFDYSRTDYGRLTVKLDGRQVLSRQGEIYFTAPGEVSIGSDKTGAVMQAFSGKLEVRDGVKLVFGE